MFKSIGLSILLLMAVAIVSLPKDLQAARCDLPGENHGDNSPSDRLFKHMAYTASLCDLAKCIDSSECANHTQLDWNRFLKSPAFTGATDDEQKDLIDYHKKGSGADGMVGYEILKIVQEANHERR